MHIELRGISKRFGEVAANADVNLEIKAGEVLALLGENGAGKSTLMKILYGFYQGDMGEIVIDGTTVEIDTPRTAMAPGHRYGIPAVQLDSRVKCSGKPDAGLSQVSLVARQAPPCVVNRFGEFDQTGSRY